jgi:hypothetical protein
MKKEINLDEICLSSDSEYYDSSSDSSYSSSEDDLVDLSAMLRHKHEPEEKIKELKEDDKGEKGD